MAISKLLLLLLWSVQCTTWASPTPSSTFSFRKTFKTPGDAYENKIAKLDKLEILERSSFSSGEEKESVPEAKQDAPKAIANALVNLRFSDHVNRKPASGKYVAMNPCCCYDYPYHGYPPCCVRNTEPKWKNNENKKLCTINIINVISMGKGTRHDEGSAPEVHLSFKNVTKLTDVDFSLIDHLLDINNFAALGGKKPDSGGFAKTRPEWDGDSQTPEGEGKTFTGENDSDVKKLLKITRCPCCFSDYRNVGDKSKERPGYSVRNSLGQAYRTKGQHAYIPRSASKSPKPEVRLVRKSDGA